MGGDKAERPLSRGPNIEIGREVQYPAWWFNILFAALVLVGFIVIRDELLVGLTNSAIFVFLYLLFGKMTTVVGTNGILVRFGHLSVFRKRYEISNILSAEAVKYSPLRNFGGWGIRGGRLDGVWTACLNLRGNRGVLIKFREPLRGLFFSVTQVLIGSERPEEIASIVMEAARTAKSIA